MKKEEIEQQEENPISVTIIDKNFIDVVLNWINNLAIPRKQTNEIAVALERLQFTEKTKTEIMEFFKKNDTAE